MATKINKVTSNTHCSLCGMHGSQLDDGDGYSTCCNDRICTDGLDCVVVVTDNRGWYFNTVHFECHEDAEAFINESN